MRRAKPTKMLPDSTILWAALPKYSKRMANPLDIEYLYEGDKVLVLVLRTSLRCANEQEVECGWSALSHVRKNSFAHDYWSRYGVLHIPYSTSCASCFPASRRLGPLSFSLW